MRPDGLDVLDFLTNVLLLPRPGEFSVWDRSIHCRWVADPVTIELTASAVIGAGVTARLLFLVCNPDCNAQHWAVENSRPEPMWTDAIRHVVGVSMLAGFLRRPK